MKFKKTLTWMLVCLLLTGCSSDGGGLLSTVVTTVSQAITTTEPTGSDNTPTGSEIEAPANAIEALIGTIGDGNGLLWYEFEDGARATKLVSSLARLRDSTELKASLVSGGVSGDAISFDGVDDRVKLNNGFNNVSQITSNTFLHPSVDSLSVAFYCKPAVWDRDQLLYEQGDTNAGVAIGIVNGKLTAAVAAGRGATATGTAKVIGEYTPTDAERTEWIHVALTYDGTESGGTARFYINGEAVAQRSTLGVVIPQTLDAAGLGAAVYGTNALKLTDAFYCGLMDDLRIYSTAIQPMGKLEDSAVFLQSAAAKNAYLKGSFETLTCDYSVEPPLRGWVITDGLSGKGVSLRLTGTNKYVLAENGKLSVGTVKTDTDKAAATFTAEKPLAVPSWGASDRDSFVSFKAADGSYIAAVDGKVSLMSASTSPLSATFKKTGDQTNVIKGLKGAVYYPSYALNAPQFWKWYDRELINMEMSYAEALGINAFRIWVSYEYWLEDPDHFEAAFADFLVLAESHGITVMVSLFEGCGQEYTYDSVHTWSRVYSGDSCGWAINSPGPAIFNNKSRWEEPKAFVTRFIQLFGNDDRLMSIEIYNEPWGNNRAALASYLCEYAVSIQGSVPLIAGCAPAAEFDVNDTIRLGMDQLQYHDNFPGNTSSFESNATGKIDQARLANLPIYCTEVQWVGGPSNINYPTYANLAPTCNKLMESGKWAPFYWTLMVHPCYLNSYRNNYYMYNGLMNEDGTTNSLANAEAWANGSVDFAESTVNPYDKGYYTYTVGFSDNFLLGRFYKWSALSGSWAASGEALGGTGIILANDTELTTFTASFDMKLSDGIGGMVIGYANGSYVLARISDANDTLEILSVKAGKTTLLAESFCTVDKSSLLSVTVTVTDDTVTLSCNCTIVSASLSAVTGQIGFAAEGTVSFDNLKLFAQ